MLKTSLIAVSFSLTTSLAFAPAAVSAPKSCEERAVSKEGKPLAGAAKIAFMKKCERESAQGADCEAKAVSKDGKPLHGAAKAASIKKCQGAGG